MSAGREFHVCGAATENANHMKSLQSIYDLQVHSRSLQLLLLGRISLPISGKTKSTELSFH